MSLDNDLGDSHFRLNIRLEPASLETLEACLSSNKHPSLVVSTDTSTKISKLIELLRSRLKTKPQVRLFDPANDFNKPYKKQSYGFDLETHGELPLMHVARLVGGEGVLKEISLTYDFSEFDMNRLVKEVPSLKPTDPTRSRSGKRKPGQRSQSGKRKKKTA